MDRRLKLHEELVNILGTRNVYFQPPSNVRMKYPAIVYKRDSIDMKHANDATYLSTVGYLITVIDEDPDSEVVKKLSKFPKTKFVQHFVQDNLNHDIFVTYY